MTTTVEETDIDAEFINALKAVIAEDPARVYESPEHMTKTYPAQCFYVHTAPEDDSPVSPGCVVGQALYRMGVSLEKIREREGMNAWSTIGELLPNVSGHVRDFANTVQMHQDRGETWAQSLANAENYHGTK